MNGKMTKYLKFLLFLQFISFANALIGYLPIQNSWTVWVSRGVTAGVTFCLFCLSSQGPRYRKAALFRGLFLLSGFFMGTFPVLAGSFCSLVSSWHEYQGHCELTAKADQKLCQCWGNLFVLELSVAVLTTLASFLVSMVVVLTSGNQDVDLSQNTLIWLFTFLANFVDILYLVYMHRTIRLCEAQ